MEHNFEISINGFSIQLTAKMNEDGHAFDVCDNDDGAFDCLRDALFKFRKLGRDGQERQFDARLCNSRVLDNGNLEMRVDFLDAYLSLFDLAKAAAHITRCNSYTSIEHDNSEVLAYAIASYT